MEEMIIWGLIVVAILVVVFVLLHNTLGQAGPALIPGLYWGLALLAYFALGILDQLFNTSFFPGCPWLLWLIWGALIGGALGLWTMAPIFGWRNYRRWIIAAPFIFMGLVQVVCLICRGIN